MHAGRGGILAIDLYSVIAFLLINIIVAALHGYGAAWIAIRMLFRPRYPIKIRGITVWPQGMIPRQRQRLAQAIGRAVGNELVSQETVFNALFEADFFRRKVESFVTSYTNDLLSVSYPSLIETLPAAARAPVLDAISALQFHVAEYVSGILKSEEMAAAVRSFVNRRVDDLLAHRLSETIDDQVFEEVVRFIEERLHSVVTAPDFGAKMRAFIGARIDEITNSRATLAEMFTPDAVGVIKNRIDQQVPPVVHQLAEIATSQKTRARIGALIKREVDDYYSQLSFFKKIFISRERIHGEVDDLVNKTLPRRVEEYLHGEAFEHEAKAFLDSTIDGVLARPFNEIIGQVAPDKMEMIKDQIAARLLALVRSPEVTATIHSYAVDALARLRPHTLRALAQHIRPESAARLKNFLTTALLDMLTRDETSRALNAMLSAQVERLLIAPIGRPTDYLSPNSIAEAGRALTERITSAARERLPAAITEFDVGGIVRRKVADYPAERLEQLVLSVAAQHLKTIEIFGAVMGAGLGLVIGVLQLFLLRVFPILGRS